MPHYIFTPSPTAKIFFVFFIGHHAFCLHALVCFHPLPVIPYPPESHHPAADFYTLFLVQCNKEEDRLYNDCCVVLCCFLSLLLHLVHYNTRYAYGYASHTDECLTLSLAYSQNELAYSQSPSVFFVVITLKKEKRRKKDALRIYVLQLIVL